MEEKMINSMDDESLSPLGLLDLMFERTDRDGVLYVPSFYEDDDDYRCIVDWNLENYENLREKFVKHYALIEQIVKVYDKLDGTLKTAKEVLKSDELVNFWNTYIRPFDLGDIDFEKVMDITDRMETIELVREIAERLAGGTSLNEADRMFLTEYVDVKVTDEEEKYRKKYVETVYKDAERRVGKKFCAHDFVVCSMRVCRLLSLNAPECVVRNEARALAQSMVLFEYGVSRECVDNTRRLQIEKMELMSDEELDELYRPKKTNTRKSLAPLFVYSILKEKSSSKKHLRQNEILKELTKYPYELIIERKALSRIIHNLADSPTYAVFQDNTGTWIDQQK